jgi:hypothetical protein
MSFLMPSLPAPPPPPPNPTNLAAPSIMEQGAAERAQLASASGQGSDGTNVAGASQAAPAQTTANPMKTVLG